MIYIQKKWQKKAVALSVTLFFFAIAFFLILQTFNENIIFFYSPKEITPQIKASPHNIRLGGVVKPESIEFNEQTLDLKFVLTDFSAEVTVHYNGIPPNLFRAKQGTVVLGKFQNNIFMATELLAKHDENYMPKEVADKLHLTSLSLKQEEKNA